MGCAISGLPRISPGRLFRLLSQPLRADRGHFTDRKPRIPCTLRYVGTGSRESRAKRDCHFVHLYQGNVSRRTYEGTQPEDVQGFSEDDGSELNWSHSPEWECWNRS